MTTPYQHTDRTTVLALAILQKIKDNLTDLGLDDALYGDQNNITKGRTAVVNSMTKTRELVAVGGPGGRTQNTLRVSITVYFSVVGAEATQRLEVDQVAENIEHLLHQDTEINNLIIHGYVTTWDPGIAYRPGSQFRAVAMEFVGITKSQLTDIPGP